MGVIEIFLRDINGKKERLFFRNDSDFNAFNWEDYDDENYEILLVFLDGCCIYSGLTHEGIYFEELIGFFA